MSAADSHQFNCRFLKILLPHRITRREKIVDKNLHDVSIANAQKKIMKMIFEAGVSQSLTLIDKQ